MAKGFGLMRRTGGVLAAYLLVLQAVVAGIAIGATPASADPFAILCRTSAASDQAPDPDKSHQALPDCCVAGCALHAAGAPVPADAVAPEAPTAAIGSAFVKPDALGPPSKERTPANPRAPPARA